MWLLTYEFILLFTILNTYIRYMKCDYDHCGVKRLYNRIDPNLYLAIIRKYLDFECLFYDWNYLTNKKYLRRRETCILKRLMLQ
jgi:hypothetical protein